MFSSSSDINFNPSVPLVLGFLFGLMTSIYASTILKSSNDTGVLYTYSHFQRFLIPGIFACVLSAILHGIGEYENGGYGNYRGSQRSDIGQGAYQLLGFVFSAAFGIGGGLLIGILYICINGNQFEDQYNDEVVYIPITTKQM